jgi:hypothetical protein
VSIDDTTQPAHTPGGTHSEIVTAVRELTPNEYFPNDDLLYQYEATYLFDAATAILPVALLEGPAHSKRSVPAPEATYSELCDYWSNRACSLARGQVAEEEPNGSTRTLGITL